MRRGRGEGSSLPTSSSPISQSLLLLKRSTRPKKQKGPCSECEAKVSPLWRRDGDNYLCNSRGLKRMREKSMTLQYCSQQRATTLQSITFYDRKKAFVILKWLQYVWISRRIFLFPTLQEEKYTTQDSFHFKMLLKNPHNFSSMWTFLLGSHC